LPKFKLVSETRITSSLNISPRENFKDRFFDYSSLFFFNFNDFFFFRGKNLKNINQKVVKFYAHI
jgi:hypothetical protein